MTTTATEIPRVAWEETVIVLVRKWVQRAEPGCSKVTGHRAGIPTTACLSSVTCSLLGLLESLLQAQESCPCQKSATLPAAWQRLAHPTQAICVAIDKPIEGTACGQHSIGPQGSSPAWGGASQLPDGLQRPVLTRVSLDPAVCAHSTHQQRACSQTG